MEECKNFVDSIKTIVNLKIVDRALKIISKAKMHLGTHSNASANIPSGEKKIMLTELTVQGVS